MCEEVCSFGLNIFILDFNVYSYRLITYMKACIRIYYKISAHVCRFDEYTLNIVNINDFRVRNQYR